MNKAHINGKSYTYVRVPAQMSGITLSTDGAMLMSEDGQLVYLSPEQARVLLSQEGEGQATSKGQAKPRSKRLGDTAQLILSTLHDEDRPMSAQDVGESLGIQATSASTALLDLFTRGYVSRKRHPEKDNVGRERLIYHYSLTIHGQEAVSA